VPTSRPRRWDGWTDGNLMALRGQGDIRSEYWTNFDSRHETKFKLSAEPDMTQP